MHGITVLASLFVINAIALVPSESVKLSQNVLDFGKVTQGDDREMVLTITNTSTRKLELEKIRTTWGPFRCVANFKTLQPNESGEMKILVSTKRFSGLRSAVCYLHFNLTEFQEHPVLIKADIVSDSVKKK